MADVVLGRGWSECEQHALRRVRFPYDDAPVSNELEVLARMLRTTVEQLEKERAEDRVPEWPWPLLDTYPTEEK
jgi:hypothetical protein